MNKFNNIEEGASAGNSFMDNSCTNSSYNSVNNETKDCKKVASDIKMDNLTEDTTIKAPQVQSPPTFVPKTDETTETLTEAQSDNSSNKNKGNPQLRENMQQLNIVAEDQGRKNKSKENEGTKEATSTECNQKSISESLSNLLAYGSSSEDSESDSGQSLYQSDSESGENSNEDNAPQRSPSNDNDKLIANVEEYRENNNSTTDEESSSSEAASSDDESDEGAKSKTVPAPSKKVPSNEGELDLDDLPPVPDLSKLDINIKEEDCIQMGNITSVVDRLVTIQSLPNTPAYDLDTLLFLDQGRRPLGHVYDVLGQVTSPMYVVRFNSKQEIESKGVAKGLPVYSAPDTEHTQYVFLKQLMKIKGSDASWQGDSEVPQEFLDFSDDEAEYTYAKQSLNEQDTFDNKRKRNSVEKHRMFEVSMNLKNKVDTARHKMRDSYEPTPKRFVPQNNHPAFYYHPPPPSINQMRQQCGTSFTRFPPPNFAAPPPNFGAFISMGPMLGMNPFGNQFGHVMAPFPPNPQTFAPANFGPPSIPPLPAMPQHVMHQPAFPNMAIMAPPNTSAMCVHKQNHVPKSPKSPPRPPQNGGVVPKAQTVVGPKSRNSGLPKLYIPSPGNYQQPYPPNLGLPKAVVPPYATSAPPPPPPNIPVSMPLTFGPPMPPWPYNLPRNPVNVGNFRPLRGNGRQYKKH